MDRRVGHFQASHRELELELDAAKLLMRREVERGKCCGRHQVSMATKNCALLAIENCTLSDSVDASSRRLVENLR